MQNGPGPGADKCHLKTSRKWTVFRNLRGPHGLGFSGSFSVLDRVLASVLGPLSQKLQNGPDPVAAKRHLKTSMKRPFFATCGGAPTDQVLASVLAFLTRF